jgi:hypothetical protein
MIGYLAVILSCLGLFWFIFSPWLPMLGGVVSVGAVVALFFHIDDLL